MIIIGCDFHARTQQIAMLDTETGEVVEKRLDHESGEARKFYEGLKEPALVGIETTGYTRWFAEMLAELGHELAVGEAAAKPAPRRCRRRAARARRGSRRNPHRPRLRAPGAAPARQARNRCWPRPRHAATPSLRRGRRATTGGVARGSAPGQTARDRPSAGRWRSSR